MTCKSGSCMFGETNNQQLFAYKAALHFFVLVWFGLEYGVWPWVWSVRFCHNAFLFDCDGRLFARRVTWLFRAPTASGSLLSHAMDCWPAGKSISTAYWWPNKRSASVRLKRSTMSWSRWSSVRQRRIYVLWFSISLVTLPIARGQLLPVALLAKSKGCSCKLPEKPWQLRQSLSSSEAQLLCSGWGRRQQSAHISKLSRHGAACCVAGKEGPLDGPN